MPSRQRLFLGVTVFAGMVAAMGISEILQRAQIQLDGEITAAHTECEQPHNNRCVTYYTFRTLDGSSIGYAAGPNDHSLQRWLPVGTSVKKQKWHLSYQIDGRLIDDFPTRFYVGALIFACCFGLVWIIRSFGATSAPNQTLQPTADRFEN